MEQEDLIKRDLMLTVLLPEGLERRTTVHGSKPVMDVLVSLCARYHLNPSDHVIELFSTNHNQLKFKPSSLIGSLEPELVMLKPKRSDIKKAPNMPVATVRLLINYRKSHKAVVRVSPRVPLAELMPAVCEKCEMDPKTTVLLRDGKSEEPLDLTKTLNDHGIRDLYAKDGSSSPTDPATLTHKDYKKNKPSMKEKVLGEKENTGLLGLFRRSRKSTKEPASKTISAATSLALKNQHTNNTACPDTNSASTTPSSEMSKKRRAPQPPSMLASRSGQQVALLSTAKEKPGVLSRISSTESSLKRNKRKAPPPPPTSPSLPDTSDKDRSYTGFFLKDAEEDGSAKASANLSSDKPACLSGPSSSLMAEVLTEFIERMKTMEQKDATFDRSVTQSPPASNLPPVAETLDPAPVVPPGCELLRDGSWRDGLTTFTVVPRRRPESIRQYEFLRTSETANTINGDTKGTLDGSSSKSGEIEMSTEDTVMVEKRDAEFKSWKETDKLGEIEAFGELNPNNNAEKRVSEAGRDVEEQDERDWMEKYRERRRRFQCDHDQHHDEKGANVKTSTKVFDKEMLDDVPAPQLHVRWEEEDTETQNLEKTESLGKEDAKEDHAANNFTTRNPNPIRYDPQRDPTSDAVYTEDPCCWDENISSNLHTFNPETPFTSSSQSSPHDHQPHSKLNPSFELSSPNSASLFAMAVSQRVQRLGNAVCPLIQSAEKKSPPAQSVGSQSISSQKLYFQNLLSQEIVSKIPPSQGACGKAPPTSTAPPSGFGAPQTRRRAWVSFSHTRKTIND